MNLQKLSGSGKHLISAFHNSMHNTLLREHPSLLLQRNTYNLVLTDITGLSLGFSRNNHRLMIKFLVNRTRGEYRGLNSKQINIAKYVSKFLNIVLFCKDNLGKMASIKTNKIKKTNNTVFMDAILLN